jgi:hypothetical protein
MIFTRRAAPLAGAGILALVLPVTLWVSGAPLAIAISGIFVYRILSLWLPLPFALASLPELRQLGPRAVGGRAVSKLVPDGSKAAGDRTADAGNADGRPTADAGSTADGRPTADAGSTADGRPTADAGSTADGRPTADAGSTADGRRAAGGRRIAGKPATAAGPR